MVKYEYGFCSFKNVDQLNQLGSEGWRVTSVTLEGAWVLMERVIADIDPAPQYIPSDRDTTSGGRW